ncbi:hypothetical protein CAPTEDRAFT_57546, partial [Capitella teleta]
GVAMLHLAAVCGHAGVVRRLINLGCDVNGMTSAGSTPLFLAVKEGTAEVVDELLKAKCDLSLAKGKSAAGMIHLAVLGNNEKIVRSLARSGCDVNERTLSEE